MSVKLAILADAHISKVASSAQYAVWSQILKILHKLKNDSLDGILVLGDLTACGDLQVANEIKKQLTSIGVPLKMIYGNSDERNSDSVDKIRSYLISNDPITSDKLAIKMLACPLGQITDETIDDLTLFVQQALKAEKQIIVGCHYPPEHFRSNERMQKLFESGEINLFIGGHEHIERDYEYENTNVHLVRGNDPDKTIDGPAAISIAKFNGKWKFNTIDIDLGCGVTWPIEQKQEFYNAIGFSGMSETTSAMHIAKQHDIGNVELRIESCLLVSQENLLEAVNDWRKTCGKILSLHMPDLHFNDAGELKPQAKANWTKALDIAAFLNADRVTVHVPRISVASMVISKNQNAVLDHYSKCLKPLLKANTVVGIENLHSTPSEADSANRNFGYTPSECKDFVDALRSQTNSTQVGFHLDVGHARNNPPHSSYFSISQWYALFGSMLNGMHLHQVVLEDDGMKNHYPITNIFGPLISMQSLMWAWQTRQIPRCPLFLEIRDFSQTLQSLKTFQNYLQINPKNVGK